MHNSIKCIAIVVFLVTLCSCGSSGIRIRQNEKEYETGNCFISVNVPVIDGLSDEVFQAELNDEYEYIINEKLNSFIATASELIDEKNSISITHSVEYNKNNLLSILSKCKEKSEATHEKESIICKNIDISENKEIKLSDVFQDERYIELLDTKLETLCESEIYSDLWKIPKITDEQENCFYFSDDGLVVYFPPYELSYYNRGYIEFVIEYGELYGYLKPQYNVLLQ